MVSHPTPYPGEVAYCPASLDHRHVWRAGDVKHNGVGGWDYIIACACCGAERALEPVVLAKEAP
jgi:hypothetical protein